MSYIQTFTGRRFYLTNPSPADVDILDIATALAATPRFGGHTKFFPRIYTVAQHCVLTSGLVSPEAQQWALMHDAPEAYINDVSTPLKRLIGQKYRDVEAEVDSAICRKFNVCWTEDIGREVKDADTKMLFWEARYLLRKPQLVDDDWAAVVEKPEGSLDDVFLGIYPWSPEAARTRFLERFDELFPS